MSILPIYGQQVTHVDISVTASTGQTLYYSITDSGAVVVNPLYDTTMSVSYIITGSLTIPNSITYLDTMRYVVAIDSNAFSNQMGLTSVCFGDSMRYIGNQAFLGCSGLTHSVIIIPGNVHYLGFDSFECFCDMTVWITSSFIPYFEGRIVYEYQNSIRLRRSLNWHSGYYWTNSGLLTMVVPHRWGIPITDDYSGLHSDVHNKYIYDTVYIGETHVTMDEDLIFNEELIFMDTLYTIAFPYPIDSITFSPIEPPYGYHFIGWEDINSPNGIDTTRIIKHEVGRDVFHGAYYGKNIYSIGLLADTSFYSCITDRFFSSYYLDTITIVADEECHGYYFSHWQDGDTTNPRSFVLTQDTVFIAYYNPKPFALVFQSADTTMGFVNADTVYGVFYDSTDYITAIPKPHFHFQRWELENATQYDMPIYNNPNRFEFTDFWRYEFMYNYPKWIAYFEIDNHTVTIQADDITHGSVSGGGSYAFGSPVTISASPYSGFRFSHWSNGATYNPYTFAVIHDTLLTAIFHADGENNGIIDINARNIQIFTDKNKIIFDGEIIDEIRVYNMMGQCVTSLSNTNKVNSITVPTAGVYFVKIGNHPARKVVVIR